MIQKRKKYIFIVALMILSILLAGCGGEQPLTSDKAREQVAENLYEDVQNPTVGSVGGEWTIIGVKKSDIKTEEEYYRNYYKRVCDYIKTVDGKLSDTKYTEYARISLALAAIGEDATEVCGYNLMKPAEDMDFVTNQGINGPIFALIAANVTDYKPVLDKAERYIDYIIQQEIPGGGFSMEGPEGKPYIDITAMALQALAYYKDDPEVGGVIERGLEVMAEAHEMDNSYSSSESISQMIIALTAVGDNPLTSESFIKDGKNLYEQLEEYMCEDGSFAHIKGDESDLMATEQALCALDSIALYNQGKMLYGRE